jgi:HNH endonuclease
LKALEAARESLYERRRKQDPDAASPTMEQQQADALELLAETALHHGIDPGTPGEVGARTRTIPPALRRALHHRDHGCRFPGCGVRVGQAHHIHHWAQGGSTKLSNLALLCRRHHRSVHEEGYQVDRLSNGELRFRGPDGRILPDVPCAPALRADPVNALRAHHGDAGLTLHARTAMPGWLGEYLDVGYAIDVLHPRARRAQ